MFSSDILGLPIQAGIVLLSIPVLLYSTQIKFNNSLTSLYLWVSQSLCSITPPLPRTSLEVTGPILPYLPCLRYCCGNTTLTGACFYGNCSPEKFPASSATIGQLLHTHAHTQHFRQLFIVKEGGDSPFFPSAGLTIAT